MAMEKLKGSLRRAFMTTVAASALFFGVSGTLRAQTTGTGTSPAKTTVTVTTDTNQVVADTIPWHSNAYYISEMDAENNFYNTRINQIYTNADNQITRLQGNTTMNNTRMWNGNLTIPRVIGNVNQTKVNNTNQVSNEQKIMADADNAAALALNLHNIRVQQIENKYKNAYMREHPDYGKVKTVQEQKLDSLNNELKINQMQLKIEQQQLQIKKLQQEQNNLTTSPAKKP